MKTSVSCTLHRDIRDQLHKQDGTCGDVSNGRTAKAIRHSHQADAQSAKGV